jgi:hypothetical protein
MLCYTYMISCYLAAVVVAINGVFGVEKMKAFGRKYENLPPPNVSALLGLADASIVARLQRVALTLLLITLVIAVWYWPIGDRAYAQLLGVFVLFAMAVVIALPLATSRAERFFQQISTEQPKSVASLCLPYLGLLGIPILAIVIARLLGPGFFADTVLLAGLFLTIALLFYLVASTALMLPGLLLLYAFWARSRAVKAIGKGYWNALVFVATLHSLFGFFYDFQSTKDVPDAVKLPWICKVKS